MGGRRTAIDEAPVRTVSWLGLPIAIEVEGGDVRYPGTSLEREVPADLQGYGYFPGKEASDGDSLDAILGPRFTEDWDGTVYLAVQNQKDTQDFLQFKPFIGFDTEEGAKDAFFALWPSEMFGGMQAVPASTFRREIDELVDEDAGPASSIPDEARTDAAGSQNANPEPEPNTSGLVSPHESITAAVKTKWRGHTIVLEAEGGEHRETGHEQAVPEGWGGTGYFKGFVGRGDGDHLDVVLGPEVTDESDVYMAVQLDGDEFRQFKILIGFASEAQAEAAYRLNWKPATLGGLWRVSAREFEKRVLPRITKAALLATSGSGEALVASNEIWPRIAAAREVQLSPHEIVEPHPVKNTGKYERLVEDMRAGGWQGRPILAYEDSAGRVRALTGSHRLAAAREAGLAVVPVMLIDAGGAVSALDGAGNNYDRLSVLDKVIKADPSMKPGYELLLEELIRKHDLAFERSAAGERSAMPMPTALPPGWRLVTTAPKGKNNRAYHSWQIMDTEGEIVAKLGIQLSEDDPTLWSVMAVESEVHGYGAYLYEQAMRWVTAHGGHMRSDALVSDSAAKVWDKYLERPDVESIPHERQVFRNGPFAPGPDDLRYEDSLQHKYRLREAGIPPALGLGLGLAMSPVQAPSGPVEGRDWTPSHEYQEQVEQMSLPEHPFVMPRHTSPAEARSEMNAQKYAAQVYEAASAHGLDPALLDAVIWSESKYDPAAMSGAGAQGILQLNKVTQKELGVKDPFSAKEAIPAGAAYLAKLLAKFKGSVDLAVAAYNAGPANVIKYSGVPPFKETQDYVAKVKARMKASPLRREGAAGLTTFAKLPVGAKFLRTSGSQSVYTKISETTFETSDGRRFSADNLHAPVVKLAANPRVKGRGPSLAETKPGPVTIYRGVVATVTTFRPDDYVTLSLKFAKGHAEHVQAVDEEPAHVIAATVPSEQVFEAFNPGEYFYAGPEVPGRVVARIRSAMLITAEDLEPTTTFTEMEEPDSTAGASYDSANSVEGTGSEMFSERSGRQIAAMVQRQVRWLRAQMGGVSPNLFWEEASSHDAAEGDAPAEGPVTYRDAEWGEFSAGIAQVDQANLDSDRNPGSVSKLRISNDGKSGYALGGVDGGEIKWVWSTKAGRGRAAMQDAMQQGGHYLDCMDGKLPKFYAGLGFVEWKREPNWTPGGPDVVWMDLPGKPAPDHVPGAEGTERGMVTNRDNPNTADNGAPAPSPDEATGPGPTDPGGARGAARPRAAGRTYGAAPAQPVRRGGVGDGDGAWLRIAAEDLDEEDECEATEAEDESASKGALKLKRSGYQRYRGTYEGRKVWIGCEAVVEHGSYGGGQRQRRKPQWIVKVDGKEVGEADTLRKAKAIAEAELGISGAENAVMPDVSDVLELIGEDNADGQAGEGSHQVVLLARGRAGVLRVDARAGAGGSGAGRTVIVTAGDCAQEEGPGEASSAHHAAGRSVLAKPKGKAPGGYKKKRVPDPPWEPKPRDEPPDRAGPDPVYDPNLRDFRPWGDYGGDASKLTRKTDEAFEESDVPDEYLDQVEEARGTTPPPTYRRDPGDLQVKPIKLGDQSGQGYQNIVAVLSKATPEEMDYWQHWYGYGHVEVVRLARQHNRPVDLVAGVVAVLSPKEYWKSNLYLADRALAQDWDNVNTLNDNREKAYSLVVKNDFSVVSGPKVFTFFLSLADPVAFNHQVVVDTHAANIWLGQRSGVSPTIAKGPRRQIAADYAKAAAEFGLTPQACQAITWTLWRQYPTEKGTSPVEDEKDPFGKGRLPEPITEEMLRSQPEEMLGDLPDDEFTVPRVGLARPHTGGVIVVGGADLSDNAGARGRSGELDRQGSGDARVRAGYDAGRGDGQAPEDGGLRTGDVGGRGVPRTAAPRSLFKSIRVSDLRQALKRGGFKSVRFMGDHEVFVDGAGRTTYIDTQKDPVDPNVIVGDILPQTGMTGEELLALLGRGPRRKGPAGPAEAPAEDPLLTLSGEEFIMSPPPGYAHESFLPSGDVVGRGPGGIVLTDAFFDLPPAGRARALSRVPMEQEGMPKDIVDYGEGEDPVPNVNITAADLDLSTYDDEWQEGRSREQAIQEMRDFVRFQPKHPMTAHMRRMLQRLEGPPVAAEPMPEEDPASKAWREQLHRKMYGQAGLPPYLQELDEEWRAGRPRDMARQEVRDLGKFDQRLNRDVQWMNDRLDYVEQQEENQRREQQADDELIASGLVTREELAKVKEQRERRRRQEEIRRVQRQEEAYIRSLKPGRRGDVVTAGDLDPIGLPAETVAKMQLEAGIPSAAWNTLSGNMSEAEALEAWERIQRQAANPPYGETTPQTGQQWRVVQRLALPAKGSGQKVTLDDDEVVTFLKSDGVYYEVKAPGGQVLVVPPREFGVKFAPMGGAAPSGPAKPKPRPDMIRGVDPRSIPVNRPAPRQGPQTPINRPAPLPKPQPQAPAEGGFFSNLFRRSSREPSDDEDGPAGLTIVAKDVEPPGRFQPTPENEAVVRKVVEGPSRSFVRDPSYAPDLARSMFDPQHNVDDRAISDIEFAPGQYERDPEVAGLFEGPAWPERETYASDFGLTRQDPQAPDLAGQTGADNIRKVLDQATDEEVEVYKDWYLVAHNQAKMIAAESGLSLEVVAAVIAALSPGANWEANLRGARRLCLGQSVQGTGGFYPVNVYKAMRAIKTGDPKEALTGDTAKVMPFYETLVSPKESAKKAVVDRHMFAIWFGDPAQTAAADRVRTKVQADVRNVAAEYGLSTQAVQAITWVLWRNRVEGVRPPGEVRPPAWQNPEEKYAPPSEPEWDAWEPPPDEAHASVTAAAMRFPPKEVALDILLEDSGIGDSGRKDYGDADAAYKRWKRQYAANRAYPKPVYDGGELDAVNEALGLYGPRRVSGLLEAFEKLTVGVRTWQDPRLEWALDVLAMVPGLEAIRLPEFVLERQLDLDEQAYYADTPEPGYDDIPFDVPDAPDVGREPGVEGSVLVDASVLDGRTAAKRPRKKKRRRFPGETYYVTKEGDNIARATMAGMGQAVEEVRLEPGASVLREGDEHMIRLEERGASLDEIMREAMELGYDAVRVKDRAAILNQDAVTRTPVRRPGWTG